MKKIINHLKENWIKYGFETFVIIVGILGAFTLNNWNDERLNDRKVKSKLKIVHQELLDDVSFLEGEIEKYDHLYKLMFHALDIIEKEVSLSSHNRQVLDSAFKMYKWLDPLFNNTQSYEVFLFTESNFIDTEIYSGLNKYVDLTEEISTRVQRFAVGINQAEYDIELMPTVFRRNSGEFVYSFQEIKKDKRLFEAIRLSKTYYEVSISHYGEVFDLAKGLENKIRYELRILP